MTLKRPYLKALLGGLTIGIVPAWAVSFLAKAFPSLKPEELEIVSEFMANGIGPIQIIFFMLFRLWKNFFSVAGYGSCVSGRSLPTILGLRFLFSLLLSIWSLYMYLGSCLLVSLWGGCGIGPVALDLQLSHIWRIMVWDAF